MTSGQKSYFLLYMAIGDAYGMAYEFADNIESVGPNDLHYKDNPKYPAYDKGHYTDDTQMALANLLKILELALQPPHERHFENCAFAQAYVEAYQRNPRPGYSRYMTAVLERATSGFDFLRAVDPSRSTASGAAMRAAPFGLLPYTEDVRKFAALQAQITHDNETGILSAQTVALAVHALHYELCAKNELARWLENQLGVNWLDKTDNSDPKNGLYIVDLALNALYANNSMAELLKYCIAYGPDQDTDTICAIAMAMASRCTDYVDDLPDHMFDEIENGLYGREFLKVIDRAALGHFSRERFAAPETNGNYTINSPKP